LVEQAPAFVYVIVTSLGKPFNVDAVLMVYGYLDSKGSGTKTVGEGRAGLGLKDERAGEGQSGSSHFMGRARRQLVFTEPRPALTQLPSVPSWICNSRATSAIGLPVSKTIWTASALNCGLNRRRCSGTG